MTSSTPRHGSRLSRRTLLQQLGATGALLTLRPASAWATPEDVQEAIRQRIGDRTPQAQGITLRLPPIAETGNSVPLTVSVDSAMTPDDHVLRIHIFVEGNPEPVVATYHLGVRTGKAEISTQIRLARSQTVLALAEMHDGTVRSAAADIVVTLGACIEES
ncbi:MAG: thiosulfate oxidation carrier protein SoxY [Candidatus Tectimicrobiota bacterium]